jgi:hypothetical protein
LEKDIHEVEKVIKDFYKEIGGNPDNIIRVGIVDDNYHVFKKGGKKVTVDREWIEDFMDDNDSLSQSKIKKSLKKL